jgi:hypothetical protein
MQSAFVGRAAHARQCVIRMKTGDQEAAADYLRAVRGLPAEIRLIGLGQALATLRARDNKGSAALYTDVETWVMGRGIYQNTSSAPALLNAIIGPQSSAPPGSQLQQNYRLAVAEIDAYLAILKRLAEVFLDDKGQAPRSSDSQRDSQ